MKLRIIGFNWEINQNLIWAYHALSSIKMGIYLRILLKILWVILIFHSTYPESCYSTTFLLQLKWDQKPAKQKILDDSQSIGQEFFNQLKLVNDLARNTTLGTIDDVLHAIKLAENGFSTLPRKMLIIQLGEYRADLLLVSPPSNAGRKRNKIFPIHFK